MPSCRYLTCGMVVDAPAACRWPHAGARTVLSREERVRLDESDDAAFYEAPRAGVHNTDAHFRRALAGACACACAWLLLTPMAGGAACTCALAAGLVSAWLLLQDGALWPVRKP